QRIRKELEAVSPSRGAAADVPEFQFVDDLERIPDDSTVTLFRGDYLYDIRVMTNLIRASDTLLQVDTGGVTRAVAARVEAGQAGLVKACIQGTGREFPDGLAVETPNSLVPPSQIRLKKAQKPFVLQITDTNVRNLEQFLFNTAYKGVTDLVTKWVWPAPSREVTRLCVHLGLRPNHVTAFSWVLAVWAGILFYQGEFAGGLVIGWLMTFLDTVDGKLARVTVTSSPFGNYFDHVLDLIHPPFWYLAWGLGLEAFHPALLPGDMSLTMTLIFVGYTAGRLVEGAFSQWIGSFGIYSWQPIDSFNRLITARRNPCLLIMTAGLMGGRPDLALEIVAIWTLVSSLFLIIRLTMGFHAQKTEGPLQSWLIDIDTAGYDRTLAVRWFSQ
ncbi:MAG: CDP-alcohol phosphatidyltransferase family protein, partial [Gammaproteobacteria bacterium]|nr:CDP-alcohol phosphatidyltransferase family protein [Gammaproteobacteria bacterium]